VKLACVVGGSRYGEAYSKRFGEDGLGQDPPVGDFVILGNGITAIVGFAWSAEARPQGVSGGWTVIHVPVRFIKHCKSIINPLDKLGGSHRAICIRRHGKEATLSFLRAGRRGVADAVKI
jgi:hypothetical protein